MINIEWTKKTLFVVLSLVILATVGYIHADTEFYLNGEYLETTSGVLLPVNERGPMPTTGDAHMLVFLVDFPDYTKDMLDRSPDAQYFQQLLFSRDEKAYFPYQEDLLYPFESVTNYFSRSSYGKLNISGDVFGWHTAAHDSAWYPENNGPVALLQEALIAYQDQIEFSRYDANSDGVIDNITIIYPYWMVDWNSMWTSMNIGGGVIRAAQKAVDLKGMTFNEFDFVQISNNNGGPQGLLHILIHELGHALGLPDYYDTDGGLFYGEGGMWQSSLMVNDTGDLDAFSKLMLGWLNKVFIVTDEQEQVTLPPISKEGAAALITPDYKGVLGKYMLAEFITPDLNNKTLGTQDRYMFLDAEIDPGLRFLRVNAEAGDYFKHNNAGTTNHLVISAKKGDWEVVQGDKPHAVGRLQLYRDGEELTPYSYPSSHGTQDEYTGINIKGIKISSDQATFTAGISQEKYTDEVTFKPIENLTSITELFASNEVTWNKSKLPYLLNGQKKYKLSVLDVHANAQLNRLLLKFDEKQNAPEIGTQMSLVIPAGFASSISGAVNKQTEMLVTAQIPQVVKASNNLKVKISMPQFALTNEKGVAVFSVEDKKMVVRDYTSDGKVSKPRTIIKFDDYPVISKWYLLRDDMLLVAFMDAGGLRFDFIKSSGEHLASWTLSEQGLIEPFRDGVLVTNDQRMFYISTDGIEELRGKQKLIEFMTVPYFSMGGMNNAACSYDIDHGEWLYLTRDGSYWLKTGIFNQEGHLVKATGLMYDLPWRIKVEEGMDPLYQYPEHPVFARRLDDGRIEILVAESVPMLTPIKSYPVTLCRIIMDNDLKRIDKKTIGVFPCLTIYDLKSGTNAVSLPGGGYAIATGWNLTPERSTYSPAGAVIWLDEDLNLLNTYYFKETGYSGKEIGCIPVVAGFEDDSLLISWFNGWKIIKR